LGFFVLFKGKKSTTTLAFFLLVVVIVLWSILNFLCDEPSQSQRAIFWNRSTIAAGFIQCIAALYFILVFSEELKKRIPLLWKVIFSIYGTSALITLTTNLIVKDVEYLEWGTNIIGGKLYFLYSPFILFAVGSIIFLLVTKYKEFKNERKNQIGYILLGTTGYLLIVIPLSVLLPVITGSNEYARFSPYAWLFFLFFTTFAITRYHLFGIKVILTELLVGLMGIILFLQIIFAQSLQWRISSFSVFLLFLIFAYSLLKAAHEEEKRREEAERLAQKERELAEKYQVLAIRLIAIEKSLKEVAERERTLRKEAEKLSQAKTEFIAIVSHQLRTPLTIISGYLSMILDGDYGEIPQKIKEIIKKVLQSTQRLIRLVNSILDISKIEAGEMEISLKRVDLREIAREVIEELKIKAKEKNLNLELKEPKEKIENLVDREKIREVLFNLVDNAIKYTQEGGITLILKREIEKKVDQIWIKDTGEGLTEKEREKVFEKFSRGGAGLRFWVEGAGLGLFISKSFVELHGGKIWVESEGKGKGSTFYIELPIR